MKEKIGSLWKRKSNKTGKTFLTGKIGTQDVIIFLNERKSQPTHPDFEVYPSEPREAKVEVQKPVDEFDWA